MARKKQGEGYKQLPRGYSQQVGSSLSSLTALSIYGFYGHPEYIRLAEYERMLTTDETVGMGIEFIKLAIQASLGEYTHPNTEIKDFVLDVFDKMEGSHKTAIGELAVSALWAGFGVSEAVYKPERSPKFGPRIYIDYVANYNPRTIHLHVNRKGRLVEGDPAVFNTAFTSGIWQDQLGHPAVQLPMARCCLATHNKRYNNYYGEPALKRIYKNWRLKESVLEMWNVALDRYGTPVTYAIVPTGYTGNEVADPSNPGQMKPETIGESTAQAITNIHTGTGLVIVRPSPQDDIELGTLTTGNNFGDSFIEAIRYYNTAILRGLLIPQLLIQEQSGALGGQAVAAIHFEIFKMLLGQLYEEIVEPFVEHIIGRLIKINFGEDNPGKFRMSPYDAATTELMSSVFVNLCNIGALDMTDVTDLNIVRAACGVPTLDAERAARLAQKNYVNSLTPDHMGQEQVTTQMEEHSSPTKGGLKVQSKPSSGGGSGPGRPAARPTAANPGQPSPAARAAANPGAKKGPKAGTVSEHPSSAPAKPAAKPVAKPASKPAAKSVNKPAAAAPQPQHRMQISQQMVAKPLPKPPAPLLREAPPTNTVSSKDRPNRSNKASRILRRP